MSEEYMSTVLGNYLIAHPYLEKATLENLKLDWTETLGHSCIDIADKAVMFFFKGFNGITEPSPSKTV